MRNFLDDPGRLDSKNLMTSLWPVDPLAVFISGRYLHKSWASWGSDRRLGFKVVVFCLALVSLGLGQHVCYKVVRGLTLMQFHLMCGFLRWDEPTPVWKQQEVVQQHFERWKSSDRIWKSKRFQTFILYFHQVSPLFGMIVCNWFQDMSSRAAQPQTCIIHDPLSAKQLVILMKVPKNPSAKSHVCSFGGSKWSFSWWHLQQ